MVEIIHGGGRLAFCSELNERDLNRLRAVIQRVHREKMTRRGKPWRPLPLEEVDRWIESMGPKVAAQRVKIAVDRGVVE